ncbi:hypothetical protein [Daejeonella sp.]|jgi:hypothetical protein|uniref:hypothetical protein n=1 Tax=Daejeonella sp. TaxID=2805397 RepID=UPI0037852797
MKKNKLYLFIISIVIIAAMLWSALSTPGVKDLNGNLRETAFLRNEQNTGPIVRIYAVTMDEENWESMEKYGNYMPHNKYGTTRVYFFLSDNPFRGKLQIEDQNIEKTYQKQCIALYEKDGMSQTSLVKYPFR